MLHLPGKQPDFQRADLKWPNSETQHLLKFCTLNPKPCTVEQGLVCAQMPIALTGRVSVSIGSSCGQQRRAVPPAGIQFFLCLTITDGFPPGTFRSSFGPNRLKCLSFSPCIVQLHNLSSRPIGSKERGEVEWVDAHLADACVLSSCGLMPGQASNTSTLRVGAGYLHACSTSIHLPSKPQP